MTDKSTEAYDVPERVAAYERAMDVMHPNRHRMARVGVGFPPFPEDAALRILDIGSGTGFFVGEWLRAYPRARAVALDGAAAMTAVASERLGPAAERVDFRIGDFRELSSLTRDAGPYDVVITMYALHHLDSTEKLAVVKDAMSMMKPGAWFVNADIIVGETPELEARNQELRVSGIVARAATAPEDYPEYADANTARAALDAMESKEGDQPLKLSEDLAILKAAGLTNVAAIWLEHRESVTTSQR